MTRRCRRRTIAGEEGGMLSWVDADSKLRLVGRRDLLVGSVCRRSALIPPCDSSVSGARCGTTTTT